MGLQYWAQEAQGDYKARVLRYYRRREAAFLQFISRLQAEKRFNANAGAYLVTEFGWLAADEVSLDPQRSIAMMRRLFEAVHEQDQALVYLVAAVAYLGHKMDRVTPAVYERFLDELLASNRSDLKLVGKIGRICYRIDSPETKQKGMAAMQALDEWKRLTSSERSLIEVTADACVVERLRRSYRSNSRPAKITESVMIPRLAALSMSLEGGRDLADRELRDWANCAKHGDCLATDVGLFLVSGQSGHKISRREAFRLCWDGRWVWATTEKAIVAVDLEVGTELTFGRDELGYEVSPTYLLCPIKPGTIAVIGHLYGIHRATRCWVSLLKISDGVSKNARVIFDARGQADFAKGVYERWRLDEGFLPLWALTLEKGSAHTAPLLAIGRGGSMQTQPLVINLDDQSASLLQTRWPGCDDGLNCYPYVIQHADSLYITEGQWKEGKSWSAVFQAPTLAATPTMFANFGVRYHKDFSLEGRPYFCGGVVHNNVLHLLTSFDNMTPHWVAVDLQTRQTFLLATTLPPHFWGQTQIFDGNPESYYSVHGFWHWGEHRLIESSTQGLVFLARGKAYSVTLPDQGTWPRYPEKPSNETTLRNWPPSAGK
jgi:hypothetical protein